MPNSGAGGAFPSVHQKVGRLQDSALWDAAIHSWAVLVVLDHIYVRGLSCLDTGNDAILRRKLDDRPLPLPSVGRAGELCLSHCYFLHVIVVIVGLSLASGIAAQLVYDGAFGVADLEATFGAYRRLLDNYRSKAAVFEAERHAQ